MCGQACPDRVTRKTTAVQGVSGFRSMHRAVLLCTWSTHAASGLMTWKVPGEDRDEDEAALAARTVLSGSKFS